MRSLLTWGVSIVLFAVAGGCKETKREQCARVESVVEDEMKATAAVAQQAAATGAIAYGSYGAALRKASDGCRAIDVRDPALRHAVDTYTDATAKLAAAYASEEAARDAGQPLGSGGLATVGIVYGTLLDQSRIAIANACP